jgi:hypothetical protein
METKSGMRTGGGRLTCAAFLAATLITTAQAAALRSPPLAPEQEKVLKENFALSVRKLKGPYTENICVCPNGTKRPIRSASGSLGTACEKPIFCAAYRAPWAEALAQQRLYLGNIFSRDVYEWAGYADHNDVVRGYVLEKYFTETNPQHKLAQLRAFRGLASSEEEAPAAATFFERYLAAPEFDATRHFLLAYELQKRFLNRGDVGQIQEIRSAATRVESMDPRFKLLKDAIHNQVSAGLIPQLAAYRAKLPEGTERRELQTIIDHIQKLTSMDESALEPGLGSLQDEALRTKLEGLVPTANVDPIEAISSLAQLMVEARQAVEAKKISPADARRLIDLDIVAGTVLQKRANALLESGTALTATQYLQLLAPLTNATYATGLLNDRERDDALVTLNGLLAKPNPSRQEFRAGLGRAKRVVEWAQANATLPFAEVWAPWTAVLPEVATIGDDILRGSPLLAYAQVVGRLDGFAAGNQRLTHDLFGAAVDTDVRAVNPGLALARLRVAPKPGSYARDEIVALPETPADLEPAAGILTRGEGNVLSHVQLLARALGIPNVVLGPRAYERLRPYDGKRVFFIVTPGGRVILKEASAMTDQDRLVYEEFTRNDACSGYGSLDLAGAPLHHIDKAKIDLGPDLPIDLAKIRRSDSGRICGPKAAFLGELKHLFPDKVSRGIVVPFGVYYAHYQSAPVSIPQELRGQNLATPGEKLPAFVERTYAEFFGTMIPARQSDKELTAWIAPRLEIVRHSIQQAPLSPELTAAIQADLDRLGLLDPKDKAQSVGCFVRSDTNVEDQDDFSGAGLNSTLFNQKSLADIGQALKEVWASPFLLRSFSWRQTLIDEPLWVLPSVVILESVPSEKSGVVVTADIYDGDPTKMTIATSEGVGGAVDGASAETLIWSPSGVEIVTLFKSAWRKQLRPGGGIAVVPASGSQNVLEPQDLEQVVAVGKAISAALEPARDAAGRARPWDIEYGFTNGKLWLFQSRPFIGNDSLKNVPALAPLEVNPSGSQADMLSLSEVVR